MKGGRGHGMNVCCAAAEKVLSKQNGNLHRHCRIQELECAENTFTSFSL